jgi:hypothetical protein
MSRLYLNRDRTAMPKRSFVLAAMLLAAPLWLALTAPLAVARTPYDGLWSVLIVTDAGDCDRAYRYALHIENGRIYYDDPNIGISGQVGARGQVRVVVSAGEREASGTGRLSADYGEGVWSGGSSTGRCSGYWQAERRG